MYTSSLTQTDCSIGIGERQWAVRLLPLKFLIVVTEKKYEEAPFVNDLGHVLMSNFHFLLNFFYRVRYLVE